MQNRTGEYETQEFPFYAHPMLVIIIAGSGTVQIEVDIGNDTWVVSEIYTADAKFTLAVAGAKWKFSTTGDASYSFTEHVYR